MNAPATRLTAIGWKAHAALLATGGVARVLAPLTASTYLNAGGQIVWLGRSDSARHPRAMLGAGEPRILGDTLRLEVAGLAPWRARRGVRAAPATIAGAVRSLVAVLQRPTRPQPLGLATLLVGESPAFPLDRAIGPVMQIAAACERDDPKTAVVAADPLLGLGPGLTPSGDDFVGGVLFARHLREPGGSDWSRAAACLVERARARTHPISVALLEDLAAGEGHEPLHDLVDALTSGASEQIALQAVDRLGALGHSSGWDMLTGFLVGVGGRAVFPAR